MGFGVLVFLWHIFSPFRSRRFIKKLYLQDYLLLSFEGKLTNIIKYYLLSYLNFLFFENINQTVSRQIFSVYAK